jgi:hypothetical protein
LIVADAVSVVAAWLSLFIFFATLAAGFVGIAADNAIVLSLGVFLSIALLHLVLSFTHHCPSCGKSPTQQFRVGDEHPESIENSPLRGWGGVGLAVLRRKKFACIHCGARYTV